MNKHRRYNLLVEALMQVIKPICETTPQNTPKRPLDEATGVYIYPKLPYPRKDI